MNGGNGAIAGQRQSQNLREAVHGIRCEHTRTRPAGRTGIVLKIKKLFGRDAICAETTYAFRNIGIGHFAAFKMTCKHRTAAHNN